MALPARKRVPQDNDGNTTEPKLHTREQQMHASLPDKSLEPQSRRHASLHPVMHANANNQHNQSTNSRQHQSNASTPALHASTPSQRLQANNSQRVALKPVERMHQPPKVSLKPASSIGNNATNKIKAEKVLHKLDENPRQLHANIPRMQPENTKLDDDLQQMDDELLGDEDVVDLEDLIDTEHTTPEYSYESDAFDTPVPDDGFDDDNESSDTDELDDALPEDSLDNAYNDYEQSDDSDDTDDIDNNDDYIDDVSDESSDDYYDNNDDYIDDIDDDTDSDDDYLDDDSDNNEESYDDDYIDDTDDELEPSLQDNTANNVNNNNTDSNANTTPDNSIISEPSDTTTNDDSSDKESKPTVSGFKAMLADFKKKIKNEIGDNNDDNADTDTDDSNEDADKKSDEQKPDDDQKPDDKPTIDNKSPLALILSIITLPFKALMFTLRTASKLMQIALSAVSMLTVLALIWLILNIPVALHTSSADFDNDEGTLTAESVKYDNGSITFIAVNNSDMIAHADITGSVKAWKPFKRIPVSLFAPVKVMDCTTSYVDMNPNESKEITIQCTGDTGLWMRPTVHITGE